jgi:hypothetical protein
MDPRTKNLGALLTGKNSSKGTFSDKFKNKMSRTKEKLDPSNILNSLFGKNNAKNGPTKAGGTFDINSEGGGLFGGYRKKDKKNLKDPKRTSIGPGAVKPLKIGDSSSDILAKMYIFMEKTHEIFKKNSEIEKKHREEQLEEDERRHKKLINELLKNQTQQKQPTEKKDEKKDEIPSWVESMLGAMRKTVTSLIGGIFKVFGSSIGLIFGALTSIATIITPILGLATGLISAIVVAVASALAIPIKMLIGELLSRFVFGVIGKIAGTALATLGGPLLAGLAALGAVAGLVEFNNIERNIREGPESQKYEDILSEMEMTGYDAMNPAAGNNINQDDRESVKKSKSLAVNKYRKEVLGPLMEKDGWKIKEENGEIVFKKGNIESNFIDEARVFKANEFKQGMFDFVKTAETSAKEKLQESTGINISDLETKAKNLITELETMKEQVLKYVPIPEIKTEENKESVTPIINQSSNNIGAGPAKYESLVSASARNNNPTYQNAVGNGAVLV